MKSNMLLLLLSLSIAILIGEIVIRVFTPHPVSFSSNLIPDEHLLYRLSIDLADIDVRGFRNSAADAQYEIAAIGDSHTYGNNVKSEKSWPKQLAKQIGKNVYNFGIGSYNIYQYFYIAVQEIERNTNIVIIAIYPPNDFFDGVCKMLELPYWKKFYNLHNLRREGCDTLILESKKKEYDKSIKNLFVKNLLYYSGIYSLFYHNFWKNYMVSKNSFEIGDYTISRDRMELHNKMTDIGNKVVADSVSNFRIMLRNLSAKASNNGVCVCFVIIPSKEMIIDQWAIETGIQVPELFYWMVKRERKFSSIINKIIIDEKLASVDATDFVIDVLRKRHHAGSTIYPMGDGHPNEYGYQAYARAAAELLAEDACRGCGRDVGTGEKDVE